MSRPSVAVIGAGVAGLTAARQLAAAFAVTVFDKARGPGGRLANRRRDGFAFDFGAQRFTTRDARFITEVAQLRAAGVVQPWHCRVAEIDHGQVRLVRQWGDDPPHYVATGRMTTLAAHWAQGLNVRQGTRITALHDAAPGWSLHSEAGEHFGPFAFVVVALPAAQAAALLPNGALRAKAETAIMQACYALMLGFETLPDPGFDAARVTGGVLSWISLCTARPGYAGRPGLVALSGNAWADAHMDTPPATVQAAMLGELETILGHRLSPVHTDLHRWRYANCPLVPQAAPLIDPTARLALCGDWTRDGRIEAAWLSGLETGQALLGVVT